jgi:hypothetical protein
MGAAGFLLCRQDDVVAILTPSLTPNRGEDAIELLDRSTLCGRKHVGVHLKGHAGASK